MNYLYHQITQKALSPSSTFRRPINYWNPVFPLAQSAYPKANFNANKMKWTLALNGMLFCFSNLIDVCSCLLTVLIPLGLNEVIIKKYIFFAINVIQCAICFTVNFLSSFFFVECCYIIGFLPSGEMVDMVMFFAWKII